VKNAASDEIAPGNSGSQSAPQLRWIIASGPRSRQPHEGRLDIASSHYAAESERRAHTTSTSGRRHARSRLGGDGDRRIWMVGARPIEAASWRPAVRKPGPGLQDTQSLRVVRVPLGAAVQSFRGSLIQAFNVEEGGRGGSAHCPKTQVLKNELRRCRRV